MSAGAVPRRPEASTGVREDSGHDRPIRRHQVQVRPDGQHSLGRVGPRIGHQQVELRRPRDVDIHLAHLDRPAGNRRVEQARRIRRQLADHPASAAHQPIGQNLAVHQLERLERRRVLGADRGHLITNRPSERPGQERGRRAELARVDTRGHRVGVGARRAAASGARGGCRRRLSGRLGVGRLGRLSRLRAAASARHDPATIGRRRANRAEWCSAA